jgi:hypothetical protein
MIERSSLKRYDFYKGPSSLGDLWTLNRDQLKMRCALATHRLGWEVRLTAGASFSRSHVCKSETEVFSTSDAWEAEAKSKGWKQADADAGPAKP